MQEEESPKDDDIAIKMPVKDDIDFFNYKRDQVEYDRHKQNDELKEEEKTTAINIKIN